MPYSMMKPSAMELMKKGRRDYADVERYCADPKAFLAFLDTLGVERAGLINYVAPRIIGFTPEVNDWSAQYCSAAPDRLIAFGGVLPGTVRDPGAEVDRLAKLGIRAIKMHPSHQALSPNDYLDGNRGLAAVYERAQAHGLPIMLHPGTSISPGARNLHPQQMLCMQISRSREDRSPGVDHDRQAMRLRALVDRGQPAISVQVVVWRERLVRRVHLDGANSELGKTVDFGPGIPNRSGENSAERDEAVRRRAAVLRAPVVHLGREADNSRSDVVDEPGAFHTKRVQKCEEGFGIGAIALDVRVVPAPLLHQLHRGGLHHAIRHDMNVNVDDRLHKIPPLPGDRASFAGHQLKRTYSKCRGWLLMPRSGGAIQFANFPGSVTRPLISDSTKA